MQLQNACGPGTRSLRQLSSRGHMRSKARAADWQCRYTAARSTSVSVVVGHCADPPGCLHGRAQGGGPAPTSTLRGAAWATPARRLSFRSPPCATELLREARAGTPAGARRDAAARSVGAKRTD